MAVAETTQRKWALVKLDSGDYLLPSNDTRTIWRIRRYEDGPSHGIDAWSRDRQLWGLWRLLRGCTVTPTTVDDSSCWEFYEGSHLTRRESIKRALELS